MSAFERAIRIHYFRPSLRRRYDWMLSHRPRVGWCYFEHQVRQSELGPCYSIAKRLSDSGGQCPWSRIESNSVVCPKLSEDAVANQRLQFVTETTMNIRFVARATKSQLVTMLVAIAPRRLSSILAKVFQSKSPSLGEGRPKAGEGELTCAFTLPTSPSPRFARPSQRAGDNDGWPRSASWSANLWMRGALSA